MQSLLGKVLPYATNQYVVLVGEIKCPESTDDPWVYDVGKSHCYDLQSSSWVIC